MSGFITIDPKPIITTKHLVGFKIDGVHVDLFEGATVRVVVYDSPMSVDRIENVRMTTAEYDSWALDDNYVVDFICGKMGFTRIIEQPAVIADVPVDTTTADVPVDMTTTA